MWPFSRKRTVVDAQRASHLQIPPVASSPTVQFSPRVDHEDIEPALGVDWPTVDENEIIYDHSEDDEEGQPPEFAPINLKQYSLPTDGRISVVGESHYQQALAIAAMGNVAGDDLDSHIPVTAALIPEPENKWDANAVRVDVVIGDRTLKVGYLARSLAEEYHQKFIELRDKGYLGTCPARIAGGGRKYYGIYLHLVYPRAFSILTGDESPEVAEEGADFVLFRSDWSCTVTKEGDHQGVLRRYAPIGGDQYREVRASLGFCEIMSGKHKGRDAIEVRLDGERVGQLTPAMTARYGSMVSRVLDRKLQPTCVAFVVRTARGIEIELALPPDPDRKPRYSDERRQGARPS